jgi:hypothetical protein
MQPCTAARKGTGRIRNHHTVARHNPQKFGSIGTISAANASSYPFILAPPPLRRLQACAQQPQSTFNYLAKLYGLWRLPDVHYCRFIGEGQPGPTKKGSRGRRRKLEADRAFHSFNPRDSPC